MKAVYQSEKPYFQLSKGDVNNRVMVYSEGKDPSFVGVGVHHTMFHERLEFYSFSEGNEHNQLTLTDPTEIQNMREYIKWRKDNLITEVSFDEGN